MRDSLSATLDANGDEFRNLFRDPAGSNNFLLSSCCCGPQDKCLSKIILKYLYILGRNHEELWHVQYFKNFVTFHRRYSHCRWRNVFISFKLTKIKKKHSLLVFQIRIDLDIRQSYFDQRRDIEKGDKITRLKQNLSCHVRKNKRGRRSSR